MTLTIVGFIIFLILCGLAWRKKPVLALGIFLGAGIACGIAAIAKPITLQTLPIWLPALPFAVVAISLFSFGILAWFWGRTP